MIITSKSLLGCNLIFAIKEGKFAPPSNKDFSSLFEGNEAVGSNFIDDAVLGLKFLYLPKIQLRVALEQNRLRIDDESQKEPADSRLIPLAFQSFNKLFSPNAAAAIGFNFDIIYRFDNVIPMERLFNYFFDLERLNKQNLLDLGLQFTLSQDKGKILNTYFLKIASPLELATHFNRHFYLNQLWPEPEIQKLFEKAYEDVDSIIENHLSKY